MLVLLLVGMVIRLKGTKKKGGKEVPNCVKEGK